MSKRTIAEISGVSFDQPHMQSLNDYSFFFFFLRPKFLNMGPAIYHYEGIFNIFSNGILHAPKFLKLYSLNQKNISTSEIKVGQK
jgi:hypothetical protein